MKLSQEREGSSLLFGQVQDVPGQGWAGLESGTTLPPLLICKPRVSATLPMRGPQKVNQLEESLSPEPQEGRGDCGLLLGP